VNETTGRGGGRGREPVALAKMYRHPDLQVATRTWPCVSDVQKARTLVKWESTECTEYAAVRTPELTSSSSIGSCWSCTSHRAVHHLISGSPPREATAATQRGIAALWHACETAKELKATAGAWVINTSSCSPGVICHFCGATWDEAWPGLASRFPLRFLLPSGYKTASDRGSRVSDANGRG